MPWAYHTACLWPCKTQPHCFFLECPSRSPEATRVASLLATGEESYPIRGFMRRTWVHRIAALLGAFTFRCVGLWSTGDPGGLWDFLAFTWPGYPGFLECHFLTTFPDVYEKYLSTQCLVSMALHRSSRGPLLQSSFFHTPLLLISNMTWPVQYSPLSLCRFPSGSEPYFYDYLFKWVW